MSKVREIESLLTFSCKRPWCTLKESSYDKTNEVYMVDYLYDVLDYDGIAVAHQKIKGYPYRLSSNDAVYISHEGTPYFIEFKNGSIDKVDIQKKGVGSAMLAMEIGIAESLKELQEKAIYILVYNESAIVQKQAQSQKRLSNATRRKGNRKIRRLIELNGVAWIYHEAFSYTISEFEENFINPIVEPEYQTASL